MPRRAGPKAPTSDTRVRRLQPYGHEGNRVKSSTSSRTSRASRSRTTTSRRASATALERGPSSQTDTVATLRSQLDRPPGKPAIVRRGNAARAPVAQPSRSTAVVTDPPYDDMIDYTDASDLFYVWLKRALGDVIAGVRHHGDHAWACRRRTTRSSSRRAAPKSKDHRTRTTTTELIAKAFAEAATVVKRRRRCDHRVRARRSRGLASAA